MTQGDISPLQVLCLTVARGCNSEWCLLLCGAAVNTLQVLVARLGNCKLTFECILLDFEMTLQFPVMFHNFPDICLLKHVIRNLY